MVNIVVRVNNEYQRNKAIEELQKYSLEKPFIMELKPPKRSLNQNDLWHKWVGIIADYAGYTLPEMKIVLKRQILGVRQITGLDGEIIETDFETAKLTKAQFSELMTKTLAFAAEYGIVLPSPEDLGYGK